MPPAGGSHSVKARKGAQKAVMGIIGDVVGVSIPTLDKLPGFVIY